MIISTGEERGSFINPDFFPDYGLFDSGVYTYSDKYWIPDDSVPEEKRGMLHIQTGFRKDDSVLISLPVITCATLGLKGFSVMSERDSNKGIVWADEALRILGGERSALGAWQNRLEHASAVALNAEENPQSAESRIRDCDMAKMLVQQNLQNILLQAGEAVLAQANQQHGLLLSLLQ